MRLEISTQRSILKGAIKNSTLFSPPQAYKYGITSKDGTSSPVYIVNNIHGFDSDKSINKLVREKTVRF